MQCQCLLAYKDDQMSNKALLIKLHWNRWTWTKNPLGILHTLPKLIYIVTLSSQKLNRTIPQTATLLTDYVITIITLLYSLHSLMCHKCKLYLNTHKSSNFTHLNLSHPVTSHPSQCIQVLPWIDMCNKSSSTDND